MAIEDPKLVRCSVKKVRQKRKVMRAGKGSRWTVKNENNRRILKRTEPVNSKRMNKLSGIWWNKKIGYCYWLKSPTILYRNLTIIEEMLPPETEDENLIYFPSWGLEPNHLFTIDTGLNYMFSIFSSPKSFISFIFSVPSIEKSLGSIHLLQL